MHIAPLQAAGRARRLAARDIAYPGGPTNAAIRN